jgi:hypothetical protein
MLEELAAFAALAAIQAEAGGKVSSRRLMDFARIGLSARAADGGRGRA